MVYGLKKIINEQFQLLADPVLTYWMLLMSFLNFHKVFQSTV